MDREIELRAFSRWIVICGLGLLLRAEGYILDGKNLGYADYVDWSLPYAAGGLYSTVEDLWRWDQAL